MDWMQEQKGPGRPRDMETERRILEVALQQLVQDGYSRMSLDAIAITAGVSKPTIYRRWTGKADLATAALRTLQLSEPPVDTGSTVGDLTAHLQNFARNLLRPHGMALVGTVLAEETHTPELLRLFRERIVQPRRQTLQKILDRAKARKELRPGVNTEAAVTALVGAFYARYLAISEVPKGFPKDVVDVIWNGIKAAKPSPRKLSR
jgi:AcrR family transcriptional regulator